MTAVVRPEFVETDLDTINGWEGKLLAILSPEGKMDPLARRVNKLSKGALARLIEAKAFGEMDEGACKTLDFLPGMSAVSVVALKLGRRADAETARKAGAARAQGGRQIGHDDPGGQPEEHGCTGAGIRARGL